jgi:hypothetical protein
MTVGIKLSRVLEVGVDPPPIPWRDVEVTYSHSFHCRTWSIEYIVSPTLLGYETISPSKKEDISLNCIGGGDFEATGGGFSIELKLKIKDLLLLVKHLAKLLSLLSYKVKSFRDKRHGSWMKYLMKYLMKCSSSRTMRTG